MKIKELEGVMHMAWSPANQNRVMIATGTAAQQLDLAFNTNSKLEIHSLNIEEAGLEMKRLASVNVDSRFFKMVWSSSGSNDGLIVGACDNGQISVFNASQLLDGHPEPLVANQKKHSGSAKTLDLNHFQTNLLASGAIESEIFIWDLNNFSKPMNPGTKCQPLEEVLSLAWNRQVQHILASVFPTKCVIWDLKKNEPIIKLTDSNTRAKWRSVAWHPEIATQLCLASEDDHIPVIQLWDLRYATAPLKVFRKHEKGILDISWCHQDSEMLLSSGKDNRILCWNPNSDVADGEVLAEIAHTNQWNFDISWCQRNPTLLSSCSYDGFMSVYSIMGGSVQQSVQTSSKIQESFAGISNLIEPPPQITLARKHSISHDITKAPKWMKTPNGASFGFGGKLIMFNNNKLTSAETNGTHLSPTVNIYQVVTDEEFLNKSKILSNYCANANFYEYCCWKQEQHLADDQKQLWDFLKIHLSSDPRAHLLELLDVKMDHDNGDSNDFDTTRSENVIETQHEVDFKETNNGVKSENDNSLTPRFPEFEIGDDTDGDISRAILIGDFKKAVNICLKFGRMTDALLIAMNGNSDLVLQVQKEYLKQNQNNVTTLISTLIFRNWSKIIDLCNLSNWKELLSAIAVHCSDDEYYNYIGKLAERLKKQGLLKEALLCYICSGLCDEFINCYKLLDGPNKFSNPINIFELMEIITILQVAFQKQNRFRNVSKSASNLFHLCASILISQGDLETAIQYVDMSAENCASDLKNRLIANLKGPAIIANGARESSNVIGQMQQPQLTQPQSMHNSYVKNRNIYAPQAAVGSTMQSPIQQQPLMPAMSPLLPAVQSSMPKSQSSMIGSPALNMASPTVQPPLSNPVQPPYMPTNAQQGTVFNKNRRLIDPSMALKSQPIKSYNNDAQYPKSSPLQPLPNQVMPPMTSYQQSATPPLSVLQHQPAPPMSMSMATRTMNKPTLTPQTIDNLPYPTLQSFPALPNSNQTFENPVLQVQPQNVASDQTTLPTLPPMLAMAPLNMTAGWNDPPPQRKIEQGDDMVPNMNSRIEGMALNDGVSTVPNIENEQKSLPGSYLHVQETFNGLKDLCMKTSNNPQMKRKMDDVSRKLDVLYELISRVQLSENALKLLSEMANHLRHSDYKSALNIYTKMVCGPDFSQIATFMPGIKMLIQNASQLRIVYC